MNTTAITNICLVFFSLKHNIVVNGDIITRLHGVKTLISVVCVLFYTCHINIIAWFLNILIFVLMISYIMIKLNVLQTCLLIYWWNIFYYLNHLYYIPWTEVGLTSVAIPWALVESRNDNMNLPKTWCRMSNKISSLILLG